MIGMVDLSGKGSKIKGTTQTYIASANVTAGSFVKLVNNKVQTATQSDKILGVAQNKATNGQTVKVIKPS